MAITFYREDIVTSVRVFAEGVGISPDQVSQPTIQGLTGPYTVTVSMALADAMFGISMPLTAFCR